MAHRGRELRHHGDTVGRLGLPALLTAILVLTYVLIAVSGCSASTPERTVEDFVSARIDGNEKKAADLTVEEDLTAYMGGEPFLYASDVTFELEPSQAEGDRATVIVKYSWEGQSVDVPYVCRRVGTRWKVALRETEELWLPDSDVEGESSGT